MYMQSSKSSHHMYTFRAHFPGQSLLSSGAMTRQWHDCHPATLCFMQRYTVPHHLISALLARGPGEVRMLAMSARLFRMWPELPIWLNTFFLSLF